MLKEKNYYCAEDMVMLDREREFISLMMDELFKGITGRGNGLGELFL